MFRLRHGLQELNHVLQMVLSARAPQFYSSQFKAEYTFLPLTFVLTLD